jgi:hypothetical protein
MSPVNQQQKKKDGSGGAAGQDPKRSSNTFEGEVVSMTGNRLVTTNSAGKEFSHTLASDARLSCDGAACTPADLKPGTRIRVTTQKDDRNVVTGIEILDDDSELDQRG